MTSCGGGGDDSVVIITDDDGGGQQQTNANLLISFTIPAGVNNLVIPADVQIDGTELKIFFPANTDRSSIISSFSISANAILKVGGIDVVSGSTPINFNDVIILTVVAENGNEKDYFVSSEANFTGLDASVQSIRGFYNAPGFQLAITRNEKLVYTNSYGFADIGGQENVTDLSVFRIASISKPITAVAIFKLVQDGLLELDDTVFGSGGVLGNDFGTAPYDVNIENITVKHLLDHKSGWTNDPYDPMFVNLSWSQSQIIGDMVDNRPLANEPGSTSFYLNFGYSVLGRVIEKVSGQAYDTYVKQEILSPAGISSMEIARNSINEKWPNEVEYFSQEGFSPYTDMDVTRMDSHGGWVASATDLSRFLVTVDGNSNVTDVLGDEMLNNANIGNNWWFAGSLPGTSSVIGRNNDTFTFVILTNTRTADVQAILNDMKTIMVSYIESRSSWPEYDLF